MKKTVRVIIFLPVFLLSFISGTSASQPGGYYPPLTPVELIEQSDVIVYGTIIGYESYLEKHPSGHEFIYTDTLLDVEYYLGKPAQGIILRIKEEGGGVWVPEGILSTTEGIGPIGESGDRAVFFLKNKDGKYKILRPNGILYLSDKDNVDKVEINKKLLSLEKINPREVALFEQLLIGVFSLFTFFVLLVSFSRLNRELKFNSWR